MRSRANTIAADLPAHCRPRMSAAAGIDTWCGLDVGRPSVARTWCVAWTWDCPLWRLSGVSVGRDVGDVLGAEHGECEALGAAGPGRRPIDHAGPEALRSAYAGSRQPDRGYRQDNAFRYLIAAA
jgi:hypothetical protein